MPAEPTDRQIRDWLIDLGMLCAPRPGAEAAAKVVSAYIPLLRDLPAGAFTQTSRAAVARASAFFPSYAELRERLESWWDANKPRVALLPSHVAMSPLSDMGKRHAAFWTLRQGEGLTDAAGANLLDMIRGLDADAYAWILGNDPDAARLAARRGMPAPQPDDRGDRSPAACAAVAASVAKILAEQQGPPQRRPASTPDAPPRPVANHPPNLAELRDKSPTVAAARALRDAVARERDARP